MYIPLSLLLSGLMLRTNRVPGSEAVPRLTTKKGSEVDRVMSFPCGPIKFPTFALADPERQRKGGMVFLADVIMALLLGRILPPGSR